MEITACVQMLRLHTQTGVCKVTAHVTEVPPAIYDIALRWSPQGGALEAKEK